MRTYHVRAINNPDVLYTQGSAAVWSAVEINIGILCNCLAVMGPFVRCHLPWLASLVGCDEPSSSEEGNSNHRAGSSGWLRRSSKRSGGTGAGGSGAVGAGSYQLHSFGRDYVFDGAEGPSTTITSGDDTLRRPDEGGILVRTSLTLKTTK
jgi:hypothetical protein